MGLINFILLGAVGVSLLTYLLLGRIKVNGAKGISFTTRLALSLMIPVLVVPVFVFGSLILAAAFFGLLMLIVVSFFLGKVRFGTIKKNNPQKKRYEKSRIITVSSSDFTKE